MNKKYCEKCSGFTTYVIKKGILKEELNGITIEFEGERAYCTICNEPVLVESIEVINDNIFNERYRKAIGIISKDDIASLLSEYDIGATELSKLLKWGDATITRYLNGQLPSAEYSATLRRLKECPSEMLSLLENK